jgi:hypothetical protein
MPLPFPSFELAPIVLTLVANLDKKNQKTNNNTHNWRCLKRSVHSKAHLRQMTQHFLCLDKREIRCNNKEGADGILCSKSPKGEKKKSIF